MTEVVTNVDARNRRRLPAWMLQVNAADEVKKSASGDENFSLVAEESKSQAAGSKIEPGIKNHDKSSTKVAKSKHQAKSLRGCDSRHKAKKAIRDDGPKASFTTCGGAKKRLKRITKEGETVNQSSTTRKQNEKSKKPKDSDEEVVSPERSNEEISLTDEDLLCIAKEYVNADKEKQREQQAARGISSQSKTSSLLISSNDDMGGALQDGGLSQILSKCLSSSRSFNLTENKGKERENNKDENVASSITSTGDAAQDMLNLYLGPLLMKAPCVEQSVRTIESEGLTSVQTIESNVYPSVQETESKGFPPDLAIQSKGLPSVYELNKQVRSCAISKEDAPLMKKKSSLKDKVAIFLD